MKLEGHSAVMLATSLALIVATVSLAVVALIVSRRARIIEERARIWTAAEGRGPGSPLDRAAERSRRLLEGSGIRLSARELTSLWGICCILPPLLVLVLGGGAGAAAFAFAMGALAPMGALQLAKRRNEKRFEELLGQVMPLISSNLRGGLALRQAIMPVCRDMDEPIRGEFEMLTADINRGMPVSDALDKMAARNSSKDLRLFASAVRAQERTGGNLADIVDTVGKTIRARVELRQEIDAKTSQGRATAVIMVIVPPSLLAALWAMNDMYREFYTTPIGLGVLALCALMEVIGYILTRKVCDIRTD